MKMGEEILTPWQGNWQREMQVGAKKEDILWVLLHDKEKEGSVEKYELGTIELSDSVYVSDPCYGVGVRCQKFIEGLKPGKYFAFMSKADANWLRCVTNLWVVHEDYKDCYPDALVQEVDIGVDSGAAGIYDKAYFEKYHTFGEEEDISDCPESDERYNKQFDLRYGYDIDGDPIPMEPCYNEETNSFEPHQERMEGAIMDNKCVISTSGLGDGEYPLFEAKDSDGSVVGLRIEFIGEE